MRFWLLGLLLFASPAVSPKPVLPLLDELLALLEEGGHCEKLHRLTRSTAINTRDAPREVLELAHIAPGTNFERDLHHWAAKQNFAQHAPDLYTFKLTMKHYDEPVEHHCLLPHELFSTVYHSSSELFSRLFTGPPGTLQEWWRAAEDVQGSWYHQHPVIALQPNPLLRVPFGFHGDEGGMRGQEDILVVTWGSVAVIGSTMDTRLVFSLLRGRDVEPGKTMFEFWRVLTWSFKALSSGKFPAVDHLGKAFSEAYQPARFVWFSMCCFVCFDFVAGRFVFCPKRDASLCVVSLFCLVFVFAAGRFVFCCLCGASDFVFRQAAKTNTKQTKQTRTIIYE
jgi:hypothetical protein